ncbi:MAG: hypothetical protein ACPG8F_03100 [Flavobacteriaceae bacterium]
MKNLLLSSAVLFCAFLAAQETQPKVMETTYLDVHPTKINRFIELHKIIFDFSMGEERTLEDSWVYRHWYGSGAAVIIMDIYPSAEAAVQDDFRLPMRRKMAKLSKEKQEEMREVFREWWSFFDGHWDEMRMYNPATDFVGKPNVDWDIPFVFVTGSYNSNGNMQKMAKAYMDWQTRPNVENGVQLGGGVTYHYKGTGSDLEFFAGFKNIQDFATTVSSQASDNPEARKTFWSMVQGTHADQIYVHVGHLEDGVLNLAGKDK